MALPRKTIPKTKTKILSPAMDDRALRLVGAVCVTPPANIRDYVSAAVTMANLRDKSMTHCLRSVQSLPGTRQSLTVLSK